MDREARDESCGPLFLVRWKGAKRGKSCVSLQQPMLAGFPAAVRAAFCEGFCRFQGLAASREFQKVLGVAKESNCASFLRAVLPQMCKVF